MPLDDESIEFRIVGGEPNRAAFDNVINILSPAMDSLGLNKCDIVKVIITDDDNYGRAIAEFSPGDWFTDTEAYRGIGKTIPQITSAIYQGNIMVLHFSAIDCHLTERADGPAGELDMLRYIVFHEFGHCVDYKRRYSSHHWPIDQNVCSFVLQCAEANAKVLVEEYAACYFSAGLLTPAGFKHFADLTEESLRIILNEVHSKRAMYSESSIGWDEVINSVISAYWRGLVEIGKFFAHSRGNPNLSALNLKIPWPDRCPTTATALLKLERDLRDTWNNYPNCNDEFRKFATEAWFTITEAEGYRFEINPEGDCLWLV